jgi:hypothetical protein
MSNIDSENGEYAYVLSVPDYGGTFSSHDVVEGVALTEEDAEKWADKEKSRSYEKVRIVYMLKDE